MDMLTGAVVMNNGYWRESIFNIVDRWSNYVHMCGEVCIVVGMSGRGVWVVAKTFNMVGEVSRVNTLY